MAKQEKRRKEVETEVVEAAPVVEDAAERAWAVRLPGNLEKVVFAVDRQGAIEAYRRELGIVATEHEFEAGPV